MAVWLRHYRLGLVVVHRGKFLTTLGVSCGGETYLFAEEVLYLTEKGQLTLLDGGSHVELKPTPPASGCWTDLSDEEFPSIVGTEKLFSLLTEASGLPLTCYVAYRRIRDTQPVVVRRRRRLLSGEGYYRVTCFQAGNPAEAVPVCTPDELAAWASQKGSADKVPVAFELLPRSSVLTFSKRNCSSPTSNLLVVRMNDELPPVPLLAAVQAAAPERELQIAVVGDDGSTHLMTIGHAPPPPVVSQGKGRGKGKKRQRTDREEL